MALYTLIAALIIAGWATAILALRRTLKSACADLRGEFQGQLESLRSRVHDLEQSAKRTVPAAQAPEEVRSTTLALITETVSHLLGRSVRVRSVKVLQIPDGATNPWAQNGRMVVQASHNLAQRGRQS